MENVSVKIFNVNVEVNLLKKKKNQESRSSKRRKLCSKNLFKSAAIMSLLMKTVWIQYLDAVKLLAGQPSV